MNENEEIIEALKKGRDAKGLSQRALGARTGVPQSHISKIETGSADLRVSSLIALARALDLELRLVPRRAIAAVDSVISQTGSAAASSRPRPAYRLDDDDDDDREHHRHEEHGDG